MLWPRLLGGVDRPYVQVAAIASLASLEKLAELAEEDCFDIVVDSSWDMDDALKVCLTLFFFKFGEEETLNWYRRTSGFSVEEHGVRS